MPLTEDAIKLEYLRKHNIPQLLDSIVLQLLEWQPEDPIEYIRNSENISARAIKSVASSFRSIASSKRVRTSSVDSNFPMGVAQISLSPKNRGAPVNSAKSQQAKNEIKKMKAERKKLFDTYHYVAPEGDEAGNLWDTRDAMQCVHIGCIALAVNSLLKRQKDASPIVANIQIEDVFYHSRLPLYYMNDDSITLAELYDIVKKFIACDVRTREMSAAVVRFDAVSSSIVREDEESHGQGAGLFSNVTTTTPQTNALGSSRDGSGASGRNGGGAPSVNSIAVKLPPLRRLLEKRSNESSRALILHFDPHVAMEGSKTIASYGSDNAVVLEESDDDEDEFEGDGIANPPGASSIPDVRSDADGGAIVMNKLNLKQNPPAIALESKVPKALVGSNALSSSSSRNGVSAVFVDINPVRHVVTLAEVLPVPKKDTISVQYLNIALPAMYLACGTLDWYSSRSRGFIEISNVSGAFGGRSLVNLHSSFVAPSSPKNGNEGGAEDSDQILNVDENWTSPICVHHDLMDSRPDCAVGIPLISLSRRIATHIIAIAWGINIITLAGASASNPTRKGIDIGDLMQTCDLPVHAVCNSMPLELVFGYCSTYLNRKFGEKYIARQYLIFVTSSTSSGSISTARANAPSVGGGVGLPSMSVMRFEQYLLAMMTLNKDPQRPDAVMLLNFSANMGVDFGLPSCSNWAILSSYDKSRQMVQLADTKPKRNGYYWQVELSALHAALVNKGGFILLLNTGADFSAVLPQSPKATSRKSGRLAAGYSNAPGPETSRLTTRTRAAAISQSVSGTTTTTVTSSTSSTTLASGSTASSGGGTTSLSATASASHQHPPGGHKQEKGGATAAAAAAAAKTSTYGVAAPRTVGLDGIRTFEFSSPIFCPTVIALAFTVMGAYVLFEDLVHCGIDISFLLSDHITLHDIARCALYMTRAKNEELGDYRISVRCMDRGSDGNPHVPVNKFIQIIEDATKDITKMCVVVNFDRRICHGVGVLTWQQVHSGGTYGVVVAYQKETQMVTVCDLNPVKYYRTWMVPLQVLYNACSQTDPNCHRSRGYIIFESMGGAAAPVAAKPSADTPPPKVTFPAPDTLGRNYDIRKMISSHPFKVPTIPQLAAVAFAISEMERPVSVEDVYYSGYEKHILPLIEGEQNSLSCNPEEVLNFRFSVLRHHCCLEDMVMYAKSLLGEDYPVSFTPVDPTQPMEIFENELRDGTSTSVDYVLIVVFQANILYDMYFDLEEEETPSVLTTRFHPCNVGAALVKHYNAAEKSVVLADVNPTRYGAFNVCSLERLRTACTSVSEYNPSASFSVSLSSQKVDWLGLVRIGK